MRKVYVVKNFGGEWEDKWESIVAVYSTKEAAEERVKEIEAVYNKPLAISQNLYFDLVDDVYDRIDDNDSEGEVMDIHKLFPQYSIKDLQEAYYKYNGFDDWHGSLIEEVDFYE